MEQLYSITSQRALEAREYNRLIRLLAQSGKALFRKYLYEPLYTAGWERRPGEARKMLEYLRNSLKKPSYRHTIAPNCKRMVGSAMAENYSTLGDCCLFFLDAIQLLPQVANAPEASEFLRILKQPLAEWQKVHDERSVELFDRGLSGMADAQLAEAFEPVKLNATAERERVTAEIQRLYQQILIASRSDNFKRAAQLLARYMIDYSDTEEYAEKDVRKVIQALGQREPRFQELLNGLLATDLYYRITQGILKGDLKVAVRMIRKYAHIFEGNPEIRYYYEIDRLERMLYAVIDRKNLWKMLKKG